MTSTSPLSTLLKFGSAHRRLPILTYHRVLDSPDPLQPNDPSQEEFETQIRAIRLTCNPMVLTEAAERLAAGSLPARSVCITFDDGYADNFEIALPILQKYNVPATFFVTTGYLNGGVMWNDLVRESIRHLRDGSHSVPDVPEFTLNENTSKWETIEYLLKQLKYVHHGDRDRLSAKLFAYANCGAKVENVMMTDEMIRLLSAAGMELGGHTVTHPILSQLQSSTALDEIVDCKNYIENVIDQPITAFAYPNGVYGKDLTTRDLDLVRKAGFSFAVTTNWASASQESNAYALPRIGLGRSGFIKSLARLASSFNQPTLGTIEEPDSPSVREIDHA